MKFATSLFLCLLISAASAGSTTLIKYSGVGFSGQYNDVTDMDETSGKCSTLTKSFSGSLSPFDEELSVHIRGPINLKKFAVYTGLGSSKKRDLDCDKSVNLVKHAHKREATVVQTATVIVDPNGGTTTLAATEPSSESSSSSSSDIYSPSDVYSPSSFSTSTLISSSSSSSSASSSASASPSSSPSTGSGSWSRVSYYDASSGSSSNVAFMGHYGSPGVSGTFSFTFGSSLSYCNAKGTAVSSQNTVLLDTTLDSDVEIALFQDLDCGDECGFSRKDVPAKKGWSGKYKIFAFNFKMPSATDLTSNNHDMPAVWLLNAKIPRTSQYGDCLCWSSGCGEMDLWEVITLGSNQLTLTIHNGQGGHNLDHNGGGGANDYFERPTNEYINVAAIFKGDEIYLAKLSDDFDFGSGLDDETVSSWLEGTPSQAQML